jgi:hypothetical protein
MGAPSSTETASQTAEVLRVCVNDGVLLLYAVLAYPSRNDRKKRTQFVMAMKSFEYKRRVKEGCDRRAVPAAYRRIRNEKIEGQMNRGFRRIGWRLSAGSMAYCMVLSGSRIAYDVPAADGSLGLIIDAPRTVNQAAKRLQEDKDKKKNAVSPNHTVECGMVNVKHRVWASSLPVLHLATALYQNVGAIMNASNAEMPDALISLTRKDKWLGPALVWAESLRLRLPEKVPTFAPEKAICLLPAEDGSESSNFERLLPDA